MSTVEATTVTVVSAVLLAPALTDLPSMWDRVTAGDRSIYAISTSGGTRRLSKSARFS